jgi:LacI family sucrose operon transcriptional repressor
MSDALCVRIATVEQDERLLAWNCFEMVTRLIHEQIPEETQRWLPARLIWRRATAK